MENLKIRIPCEEVSELVQEKAFEKGYKWEDEGKNIVFRLKRYLYLGSDGYLTFGETESFFNEDVNKEISWQEWVYGEGYFFKHTTYNTESLYYQAKASKIVVWCNGSTLQKDTTYAWEEYVGSYWYKTDMYGNKLEEKEMEQNVKLYDDKINVELTAYQVATIRVLFGKMCSDHVDGLYSIGYSHFPIFGKHMVDSSNIVHTTTKSPEFIEEVESVLKRNGYVKEAPKPVKEMSLADVQVMLKDMGYDVKIKKE